MVNSSVVGRRMPALLAITLLCAGLSGCATQATVVDLERDLALLKLRMASEDPPAAAPGREVGMVRASNVSPGGVNLADSPTELLDLTVSVDQLRTELSEIRGQMDELLYSLNSLTEDNDARLAALERHMGAGGAIGGGTGTSALTIPPRFPDVPVRDGVVEPLTNLADEPLSGPVAVTPAEAVAATQPAAQVVPGPQGAVVLPGVMIAPRAGDVVNPTLPGGLVPAGSVSAQTAYSLAARDLEQGHNSLAAAGFANFLNQYPDSPRVPQAAYSLGLAYMRQGMASRAVDVWQQQVATFPDHSSAPATLLSLGEAYRALDNIPAAEQAFKRLIARFPTAEQAEQAKLILSELR